jgi:hypothetical protein
MAESRLEVTRGWGGMENYYLMYIYIPFGIVKKSSGYGQY